jgi:hypothetical protein
MPTDPLQNRSKVSNPPAMLGTDQLNPARRRA